MSTNFKLRGKANRLPRLGEVERVGELEDDEERCDVLSLERDFAIALLSSAVVITGM